MSLHLAILRNQYRDSVALMQLSAALARTDASRRPAALVAELADAETRVMIARRFYNDAVRDTRSLGERRLVRRLHLGGTAPLPQFFEIIER